MSNITEVPKPVWESDLENTKKELAAYKSLTVNYQVLANLPENKGNAVYSARAFNNEQSAIECQVFLDRLIKYGKDMNYERTSSEA